MSGPSVKIPQDLSIEHKSQRLHVEVGPFDGRGIEEHEKNACHGEDDEEKARDSTKAKGIGESKAMTLHFGGKDMEEEVVVHDHRSFEVGIRYSGPEDGLPDC
jgi:hypothetical protein